MISKEITSCVVDYISTIAWRNKNIIRCSHPITTIQQRATLGHYRDLGLLFKRCTLLQPTKERLKFIFSKFSQCDVPDCRGFTCYGAFLQTLIAGWDELECHRVFNFLCDLTNLLQKTEGVVMAKPGRHQELQLRLFCRHVLLNPWLDQSEGQFWLMLLLKPWPLFNQAKILFILYGPLLPEGESLSAVTFWTECGNALDSKDGDVDLRQILVFELIVIPEQWHIENVARLLVLCGSSLCYTILASKALNGRLPEVSRLIVFIILVCQKDGYHISWAVKLVQAIWKAISTPPERFNFILQLENTFSDVTKEFYEQAAAGETERERELFISHFLGLLRPKMSSICMGN
uniref:FBXO47 ARM repeats region domain-containing protein n=1 Tax=Gouania willdenowi TaxID=441366 RepID=A0A8C5DVW5_GOUWI